MQTRRILRLVMVVIGVVIVVVVWTSWRSRSDEIMPTEVAVAGGSDEVVAVTDGLSYTADVNGVPRYTLTAGKRTGYRDGRSEFTDGVSLVIYGEPAVEGELPEATTVFASSLQVTERVAVTEENRYEEIRLIDNVRAELPGGADLTTDLLVYKEGHLSTTEGVFLRVGGMIIEAKEFRYNTETEIGDVWAEHPQTRRPDLSGDVKLWGDPDAISTGVGRAPDLVGHATTLRYAARAGELTLGGGPIVELPDATLEAINIALSLDVDSNQLRGIQARNAARARWLGASAPGEHLIRGDLVDVELDDDAAPVALRVTSREDSGRPRFTLGDSGELRADVIELALAAEGAGAIAATGTAFFFPGRDAEYLRQLGAGSLHIGSGGLEEMRAEQGVEIVVAGAEGSEVTLSGAEATFTFSEGIFRSADLPAGLRYESGGQIVEAPSGSYDADASTWTLPRAGDEPRAEGTGRPTLEMDEYEASADQVVMSASGRAVLSGDVRATLRGAVIAVVAPVFGGAAELGARGSVLVATPDGRLTFSDGARISQGSQLLQADEIMFLPASDELQASGGVLASLVDPDAVALSGEAPRNVMFAGDQLLVEGSPPMLVMAGAAMLEGADERTISGDRIDVQFLEEGGWDSIEVHRNVIMVDPAGTAQGDRLEYDAQTGIVEIYAAPNLQASFSNSQGLDIQDPEGLRLQWGEDSLAVTAMQKGTTQTVRSR